MERLDYDERFCGGKKKGGWCKLGGSFEMGYRMWKGADRGGYLLVLPLLTAVVVACAISRCRTARSFRRALMNVSMPARGLAVSNAT